MEHIYDVCIVGAGPGGTLLAYLLAKNNISTVLLERNLVIDHEFRGEHLNNEGEQVLRKYNLFEKVEKCGLLMMERVEYWEYGNVIKTVTPSLGSEHVGIHVPQKHLLNVMVQESEQYKNLEIMLGTRVTELINDDEGNFIGVKAIRDDEEIIIKSSITIGADGRYSTVRKLANIQTTIIKHGYDLLWAKIPSPVGWEPTIRQTLIDNRMLALFTQAGGFIQVGWNIKEDSYPHLIKQSFDPFIQQITDAFPELTEIVHQNIKSWKDFILLHVQSCRCETWVKDGLVIMGDAAHTMSPMGALGINCALKDASVLNDILKDALLQNDTSAKRLKQFETGRREEIEKLQEFQIKQESIFKLNFTATKDK